ncbi:MAG: peptidylprolyl isomerase [Deltaproteobacteria bacterium]|nr:peptidylprolyl isomerase [Deltaproteobacteria bacterium]
MKRKASSLYLALATAAALGVVACNSSSSIDRYLSQGKALARVGNEKINEGYLLLLQKVNPGIKAQIETPQGKKRIVDNLIEQEMLYQESVSRGLDKQAAIQEKVDLYKRVMVAQSLLENELDKKTLDYYNQNKAKEFERIKVSHIFFASQPPAQNMTPGNPPPPPPSDEERKKAETEAEAKAKKAYDRLKAGEPWDTLVKDSSDDKMSAENGGDFGYITRGDRRIERLEYQGLVDAAFKMKKGEYSEPIKAKDGWHILKAIEEKEIQSFEEASNAIKLKMRGEVKGLVMADLKKKMKVEYLDTSLADSTPSNGLPVPPAHVDGAPTTHPTAKPEAKSEVKAEAKPAAKPEVKKEEKK